MIDSLHAYPEYKDSALPWLGRIPKHWVCTPLKRMVGINLRALPETTDPDIRFHYLDIGSVATGYLQSKPLRIRFGDAPSRARRVVQRGDTIVSTVRTYLRAVYHFDNDVADHIVSTGFAVLTPPSDSHKAFFGFLAESAAFVDCVVAQSNGIAYPAISERRLGQIPIAFPPDTEEQKAIADYLKAINRQVRRFIRNRRRLIEVLNEQKQAIINRAVIRGLDPNVPLKPSGIDWLGDIPEHWSVVSLRRVAQSLDGQRVPLNAEQRGKMQGDYPYWGANTVIDHVDQWLFDEDLVLLGEDGAPFFVRGRDVAFHVSGKVWVNNHAHVLRPKGIVPQFLAHALNCVDYAEYVGGATRDKLTAQSMKAIPIQLPPADEQVQICAVIADAVEPVISVREKTSHEIALIREYRTRLIADVVKGKVDVRHLAPPPGSEDLEEMVDELEPLDDLSACNAQAGAAGELEDEALAGEVG